MLIKAIDLRTEQEQLDIKLNGFLNLLNTRNLTEIEKNEVQEIGKRNTKINAELTSLAKEASQQQLDPQLPLRETLEMLKKKSQALVYRALRNDQVGVD